MEDVLKKIQELYDVLKNKVSAYDTRSAELDKRQAAIIEREKDVASREKVILGREEKCRAIEDVAGLAQKGRADIKAAADERTGLERQRVKFQDEMREERKRLSAERTRLEKERIDLEVKQKDYLQRKDALEKEKTEYRDRIKKEILEKV